MRVIAGEKKHLLLKTLGGIDIRPTTDKIKETLFNMLQFDLNGINFLDLYAGSGAIGIEALSRGAKLATFVDQNVNAIKVIKENLSWTKLLDKSKVFRSDCISFIESNNDNIIYDIIFMDPPYEEKDLYIDTLKVLSKSSLLNKDTKIIVECAKDFELSFINDFDFEILKEKEYKTNKHIFLRKKI